MSCITYAGIYENNEEQNRLDAELEKAANPSTEPEKKSAETG